MQTGSGGGLHSCRCLLPLSLRFGKFVLRAHNGDYSALQDQEVLGEVLEKGVLLLLNTDLSPNSKKEEAARVQWVEWVDWVKVSQIPSLCCFVVCQLRAPRDVDLNYFARGGLFWRC